MALSEKQSIFADYLLKKIGFNNSELISEYLVKLELIYGKYYKELIEGTYSNGKLWYKWIPKYNNSQCIEELLKEIEVKKNTGNIKLQNYDYHSKISATDLSSFEFCPASFSISKSFLIESPTNEDKRLTGINLHEMLRLIDKKIPQQFIGTNLYEPSIEQNQKVKRIKECELVFAGHSDQKKYFINEEKNYVGQPDYIFRDPNGKYFVVEEKFKYLSTFSSPNKNEHKTIIEYQEKLESPFFSNHIVQLQSYIDYIEEYDIDYGILIYWFYDFQEKGPNVHKVSLKIIKKGEHHSLLQTTHNNLSEFIREKSIDFDKNTSINKCVACSVNKYCAHKTHNLLSLKFPYDKFDLALKNIGFPEILKKKKQ